MKLFFAGLLLNFFLIHQVCAQTEFRFEHYTTENGLSTNFTKAITQDQYGLLWVGTIDGLNSFNGYDFVSYNNVENDAATLSDNSINDLFIDKSGTLWVATNKGVNKFLRASGKFLRIACKLSSDKKSNNDIVVTTITEGPGNKLWLGTNKGIRIIDPDHDLLLLPDFKNPELQKFVDKGISGILFDKKGRLWIGSSTENGFRVLNATTFQPVAFQPEHFDFVDNYGPVNNFFEDSKGVIWIMGEKGLFSYDPVKNILKRFVRNDHKYDDHQYSPLSILEDNNHTLWTTLAGDPPFYTGIAKILYDSSSLRLYPYTENDERGLSWSWVSSIFQDKSGIYWVGTSRGLDKLDPLCQQFKLYQQYSNVKYSVYNNIYAIVKEGENIWLGTDGKGLIRYHIPTKEFTQMKPPGMLADIKMLAILSLGNGNLLLGTSRGVYEYNIAGNSVKLLLAPPNENDNSDPGTIIKGNDDEIWIGWNGGGITRYNMKTKAEKRFVHNETDPNSVCSDQINFLFRDRKGVLWVTTADGLNSFGGLPGKGLDRFDEGAGTFTHFHHDVLDTTSLSNNNVVCLAEDKNGVLWIGTRNGGLNKFDAATGKFKRFNKTNGLHSNFISSILIDDENTIWMSSFTNGIASLNQSTGEIKKYNVSHGLQNLRFNIHASYKAPDGELYFGGVSGFNSFYPANLKSNTVAPKVLLTGIKINNVPYETTIPVLDLKQLNLDYHQTELQFDFAAINYSQSLKNQYAYQLVGYDKAWIYSGTIRTAKYTNLDAGNYTFMVKASNNDGVWNETGTSLNFTISPPWWQTWWAYLLYAIAFLSAVYGVIRYRSIALKRKNKLLAEMVASRTSELQQSIQKLKAAQSQLIQSEKMASLGELTAGIAHEIQNPLNFVNNFSELSRDILQEINEEMKKGNSNEIEVLAKDLNRNLEKINHHGKRAEGIVKGMLLHSRQSTGEYTQVNLNKLVDEFMRLSFHGLRAKDKSINANIKTEYDTSIETITGVEQDLGRVVLNLVNNALYSVSNKKASNPNFEPIILIKTKNLGNKVEIEIKDNGNGIPKGTMDKIFQPFFTTKPTGQGTGLGLSLSYDVIHGHGGTIEVNSTEGEGATFTIQLPVSGKDTAMKYSPN